MSDAAALFAQVLGAEFARLAAPVQALHRGRGRTRYAGRVDVEQATHPLARVLARVTRLPPAMRDAPLTVEFIADANGECWRRDFDGHAMHSRLHVDAGSLTERLGPARLTFALTVDADGALHWRIARVRLLGVLPLPRAWFDAVRCREGARDGRYAFEVDAAMPVIGCLVRYRGWLERA